MIELPPLLCFPFAGAGAGFFRQWRSESLKIHPVQLPGREELFAAPFGNSVTEVAIDCMARTPIDSFPPGTEVALYGHSFGAVVAYECAKLLESEHRLQVRLLVVSGSPSPDIARVQRAKYLSDDDFVHHVEKLAGFSHPALQHTELRQILLPPLRSDVQMHEAYQANAVRGSLKCSIASIRGDRDDLVTKRDAEAWQDVSTGSFQYMEARGGHMFLAEDTAQTLTYLQHCLTSTVERP